MKFSVVIPCHNAAKWLPCCLDSVGRQNAEAIETIVLLDRCSDASADVATAHSLKPRIIETDLGNAASVRNVGARHAQFPWIAFLDSDDWWSDSHLATVQKALEQSGDIAFFGNFAEYYSSQELMQPALKLPRYPQIASGLDTRSFWEAFTGPNQGWPTSGMVVNRARFLEVGGFDETQRRRHDTEMFSRVVYGHTWTYSPETTFYYRKELAESISANRVECSYYRMMADIKIARQYREFDASAHLKQRARICMGDALRLGTRSQRASALALCRPWLSRTQIMAYQFLGLHPPLAQGLLAILDRKRAATRGTRS